MAQISKFTDWVGGAAERANEIVQDKYPQFYPVAVSIATDPVTAPSGGTREFSEQVAANLYNAIIADVQGGGTGVLDERNALEAARLAWDAHNLGEQFPGNPLLAAERLSDFDFSGAWQAFNSEGTDIAINAGLYQTAAELVPDNQQLIQELANDSYHLTEDGKASFFVDANSGHVEAVFAPPITTIDGQPLEAESTGVLNAFPSVSESGQNNAGWNIDLLKDLVAIEEPQHYEATTENGSNSAGNDWLSGMSDSFGLGVQSNQVANAAQQGFEQMWGFLGVSGSSQNEVAPYSSQAINSGWHTDEVGGAASTGFSSLFSNPFETSHPTFDTGASPVSHNDNSLSHSSSDYSSSHSDNSTSTHSDSGGSHSDSGGGDSSGGSSGASD